MSDPGKPKAPRKRSPRQPKTSHGAGERHAGDSPKPTSARRSSKADQPGPNIPGQPEKGPWLLIRAPLSVRWRDLDAFNHVNNSKFLSYLEEARLRWMVTIPGEWIDENVAPVVAAANVNYRRPIEWPNEIVIELFVQRLGNTSLTIGHRILNAADDKVLYADGNVVMVWIDKHGGQAAPLPESVRVACARA